MFSGIVEEVGQLAGVQAMAGGRRMRIACRKILVDLQDGDSVAVDGVCQTVVAHDASGFDVEAIATTLSRTTFAGLSVGDPVNLERALAFGARVGGHLVQGHVDGVGRVHEVQRHDEHVLVDIEIPEAVAEVTVLHGSITVNGVSLTVNAVRRDDVVQVALIPYTWDHTNLRHLRPGAAVNLEGDLLGRYVVHWLKRQGEGGVAGE